MNVIINGFEKSWCGSSKGTLMQQIGTDMWAVKIIGGKHNNEIFTLTTTAFVKEK